MITLKAFVKKSGSQEKAARALNVTTRTIQRWLDGTGTLPLYAEMLKGRGIIIG